MNGESKTKDILSVENSEVVSDHPKTVNSQQLTDSKCSNLNAMVSDGTKQKKSLFQITRIVKNNPNDQTLTEVVESMSESKLSLHINGSLSDESLKSIDVIDGNLISSSNKTSQHPIHDSSRLGNLSDAQTSRFKVVRISSHRKPVIRGRWSCQDFEFDKPNQNHYIQGPAAKLPKTSMHQTGGSGDDKPASNDSGSEGSSLLNSIYFVQSGDEEPTIFYNPCGMVYANGHLTLENILPDNHSSGYSSATVIQSAEGLAEHPFGFDGAYGSSVNLLDPNSTEVAGIPELIDPEACGAANSMCALDNKIEQAMDLVKSHLMFAVHEEVEQLKEQIKDLMIRRSILEQENSILRASATPETLAKLKGVGGTRSPDVGPAEGYSLDGGHPSQADAVSLL